MISLAKLYKIEIGKVMVDPVSHVNITKTVVIHVKNEAGPAPIGTFHAAKMGNFRKGIVPVVQL